MITVPRRANFAVLTGGGLAATALILTFAIPQAGAETTAAGHGRNGQTAAVAHNGDNGTVKIHRSTTPVGDRRNEPHVCTFYLDAFGFDPAQSVTWYIESWPPTGDRSVVAHGMRTLDANGDGRTQDRSLPDGHYKLFWNFTGEHGAAKHKVFWVSCRAASTPTPSPTQTPTPSPTQTPGSGSASPTPSARPAPAAPSAPAPTPVKTVLPVTG